MFRNFDFGLDLFELYEVSELGFLFEHLNLCMCVEIFVKCSDDIVWGED